MKHCVFVLALVTSLVAPIATLYADDEYNLVPLSPNLPLIGQGIGEQGPTELLNALLAISVVVAAMLAVVMVAIGGFKYMTTDSVFAMGNAKEQIANAVIGLLIVLCAILILNTINPNIVNLRLFDPSSYGDSASSASTSGSNNTTGTNTTAAGTNTTSGNTTSGGVTTDDSGGITPHCFEYSQNGSSVSEGPFNDSQDCLFAREAIYGASRAPGSNVTNVTGCFECSD